MKRVVIIFFIVLCFVCESCERMPLYERQKNVEISFVLHSEDILYNMPKEPDLIMFCIYDVNTDARIVYGWAGPNDVYSFNVEPGVYNILTYSLGSSTTDVSHSDKFNLTVAETAIESESSSLKVIKEPDHIYVGRLINYTIPVTSSENKHRIVVDLYPILDSYKLVITDIEGLKYAASINSYFYDQKRYNYLKNSERCGNAVLDVNAKADTVNNVVNCPFNTFGMPDLNTNPGDSIKVRTIIVDYQGIKHIQDNYIQRQVRDSLNREHIIQFSMPVKLLPKTQGGFDPSTDEWNDNIEHYDLM